MPESDYVFERGEPIQVGSHGEHIYVFSQGEPVTDAGVSEFVFESGTGLGGEVVVEGTSIGYFESAESGQSFYNGINDGSYEVTNSPDERTIWAWVHHDSSADEWMFTLMSAHDQTDGTYIDWRVEIQDSADPFNEVVFVDGESPAVYGTLSDGDYYSGFRTASRRDGIGFDFDPIGFTIYPDFMDNPNYDTQLPERIVFIGPDGDPYAEEIFEFPNLLEVSINV